VAWVSGLLSEHVEVVAVVKEATEAMVAVGSVV